jgi:hypothetical protein
MDISGSRPLPALNVRNFALLPFERPRPRLAREFRPSLLLVGLVGSLDDLNLTGKFDQP